MDEVNVKGFCFFFFWSTGKTLSFTCGKSAYLIPKEEKSKQGREEAFNSWNGFCKTILNGRRKNPTICVQMQEQSTESEKYRISYWHDNIEESEDNWPATIFREDERQWQKQCSLSFHAIPALLLCISPLSTKTRIGICSRVPVFLFQLLAAILPEIFFRYVKGLPIRDRIVKRRATNLPQYH